LPFILFYYYDSAGPVPIKGIGKKKPAPLRSIQSTTILGKEDDNVNK